MWSVSYLIYYSNSSFWCLNVELLSLLWIAGPHAVIPYSIWECINDKYKVCSVDFGRKFFTYLLRTSFLKFYYLYVECEIYRSSVHEFIFPEIILIGHYQYLFLSLFRHYNRGIWYDCVTSIMSYHQQKIIYLLWEGH